VVTIDAEGIRFGGLWLLHEDRIFSSSRGIVRVVNIVIFDISFLPIGATGLAERGGIGARRRFVELDVDLAISRGHFRLRRKRDRSFTAISLHIINCNINYIKISNNYRILGKGRGQGQGEARGHAAKTNCRNSRDAVISSHPPLHQ
jgi:hypothetical protein